MAAYINVSGEAVLTCRCALGPDDKSEELGLLVCAMHVRSYMNGWYPPPTRKQAAAVEWYS